MADESAAVTAPVAIVAPVVAAAVAPLPPAPPASAPDPVKSLLSKHKLTSEAELEKILVDHAAAAEAAKSDAEKAAVAARDLAAEKVRSAALEDTTRQYASRMMVPLTESQCIAVKAIAGDDPQKQIAAIAALQPTWSAAEAAAAPATKAVADTAPPAAAAPGAITSSPPKHSAVYAELKSKNPFAAAEYAARNDAAYS